MIENPRSNSTLSRIYSQQSASKNVGMCVPRYERSSGSSTRLPDAMWRRHTCKRTEVQINGLRSSRKWPRMPVLHTKKECKGKYCITNRLSLLRHCTCATRAQRAWNTRRRRLSIDAEERRDACDPRTSWRDRSSMPHHSMAHVATSYLHWTSLYSSSYITLTFNKV